ncbi:Fanconi-associated nuclease 1 like protein [Argiope bruennichi]|uniref:Fanconi-associated nuclease n=1 Tax=Argiope bruennichi TaxID=94029 RepID=A0A8T0EGV8_ARGBR|nr:Fanconi-associated nuclease 1 like protein [Argiope bruennichi]
MSSIIPLSQKNEVQYAFDNLNFDRCGTEEDVEDQFEIFSSIIGSGSEAITALHAPATVNIKITIMEYTRPTRKHMEMIVEVKSPGDKLSSKQILWLDYLIQLGADAEVCLVEAVASKKLRKETSKEM